MRNLTVRVLLVDASKKDYRITRDLLRKIHGKKIILKWAQDYETAFALLRTETYHICLLEYQVIDTTVVDFLKKARFENIQVPIIILTNTKTRSADILTMRYGASDYLVKDSLNASLLERSIRYTLERKKAEQERLLLFREQSKRIEAEIAQQRLTFLSEASKILAASLDYRSTLQEIAKRLVPNLADWCIIDVLGPRGFERVSVLHKDPLQRERAEELERHYQPDLNSPGGVGKVLRTGKTEMAVSPTQAEIINTTRNDQMLLKLVNLMGLESYLIVPVIIRGKVLGAISLAYGTSGRKYSDFEKTLMEELAQRLGLAIENARLYEQSLESIKIREEFLNIASHELKTPLTSLQLQIQLLGRSLLRESTTGSEDQVKYLLSANIRQVQRLTKLINNLLDVSRIEAKSLDLEKERCDISQLISEVIGRFHDEARMAGSEIHYKNSVHPIGYFDRFRIDQVVTNLLSNAIKYGQGKPINVVVSIRDKTVILKVIDHGIGIDPSEKRKIFDRFERIDMTKKLGGIGLGLYIVLRIVTAHEGTISVTSTPEKGSSFIVTLPLRTKK
jgi:signal transduction histidine kinase/DNA-binding response OmpR family regulator